MPTLKRFLVVLYDNDGIHYKLCAPEVEAWLDEPTPDEGAEQEPIPDSIQQTTPRDEEDVPVEKTVRVSCGSGDNDRALAAPGLTFTTLRALLGYMQDNAVELTGEYTGCIY
jgi:hypothetical protein